MWRRWIALRESGFVSVIQQCKKHIRYRHGHTSKKKQNKCDSVCESTPPVLSLALKPLFSRNLNKVWSSANSLDIIKSSRFTPLLITQQSRSFSRGVTLGHGHKHNTKRSTNHKSRSSRSSRAERFKDQGQQLFRRPKSSLVTSLLLDEERNTRPEKDTYPFQGSYSEIENIIEEVDKDDSESLLTDSEFSDEDDSLDVHDELTGEESHYLETLQLDLGFEQDEEDSKQDSQGDGDVYGGVPDPTIPISNTPCSGCGALLHCQDTGIPGYMPSQKFLATPKHKLRERICQRCYIMQRHNVALKASVSPEEYRNIIKQIKNVHALVVVVVDVMDMPNSIFPNLTELIGKKRPLYIVGNKADLLPQDSVGYLKRLKDILLQQCEEAGLTSDSYINHVGLISAKTGYGIEDLTTRLLRDWGRKGHIYILGCTNVGKSSLFNAFLASDLCKETATDLINRATISTWPGTTLNLLKFPVINPEPWKLAKRIQRLKSQEFDEKEEREFLKAQYKDSGKYPTLIGHIGRTFQSHQNTAVSEEDSKGFSGASFSFNSSTGSVEAKRKNKEDLQGHKYDEERYANSRWCYDTPGVVNPEQFINQLTEHELSVLLTNRTVTPRSFILKQGQSMHVSGLSRIDYVQGERSVLFTVFAARAVPVSVRDTTEMEEFYKRHIGTKVMGVPLGDSERLTQLPSLKAKDFHVVGYSWQRSVADVILSSIGWVAVTPGPGLAASLRAYTPGGLGCSLRTPPLLPYAVNQRGKRSRSASYKLRPLKVYS